MRKNKKRYLKVLIPTILALMIIECVLYYKYSSKTTPYDESIISGVCSGKANIYVDPSDSEGYIYLQGRRIAEDKVIFLGSSKEKLGVVKPFVATIDQGKITKLVIVGNNISVEQSIILAFVMTNTIVLFISWLIVFTINHTKRRYPKRRPRTRVSTKKRKIK